MNETQLRLFRLGAEAFHDGNWWCSPHQDDPFFNAGYDDALYDCYQELCDNNECGGCHLCDEDE